MRHLVAGFSGRGLFMALVLVGGVIASAQDVAFEVASVKPNNSSSTSSSSNSGKGSLRATNRQLRLFIAQAFGFRSDRIAGPAWIDTARFDISARAPENTPDSQLSLMLRALLIDRFKLMTHTEMRDQPIYALVLANSDGKLRPGLTPSTQCDKNAPFFAGAGGVTLPDPTVPSKELPCGVRYIGTATGTVITGGAIHLSDLARSLESPATRYVVDRTGLTGTYNVQLRFSRPSLQAGSPESPLPVLFTALQEQLGLKLDSARGPVEFLVVDRVEQPTPD